SAEEIRRLRERWAGEVPDAGDAEALPRWLVAGRHLTAYQASQLAHGRIDQLFFGPYKVLDRLARGRTAVVYRGADPQGHPVALKVLPARDRGVLARFRREAEVARRREHPHVVRTLDAGEADGLPYLAMELLEGETLQQVLARRGRLPVDEAVDLLRHALLGLQHLNEAGLVPRDPEPADLM